MQIQLGWLRYGVGSIPRSVKPLAKGTNTAVFAAPDPSKVIVFLLCGAKKDWWVQSGLVTNPDTNHFFKTVKVQGNTSRQRETFELDIYRVQAKRLYKPENGSPQRKEIVATVKAMNKIYMEVLGNWPLRHTESVKTHWRNCAADFWNRVYCSDLPTKEMAGFAMDYYVLPDLGPRNALVDADGEIAWSDLFITDHILEFVHARKHNPDDY